MGELDALDDSMMTDATFHSLLDAAGEVYVQASGQSALLQKLG